ncbi:uncharacterized protein TRIREDRAFT_111731 [Trichoderma reesei QM6a]|uniref:Predicted protein n=2 Tax=Hypocrea jecorina TaxID=51453 RepID=G0RVA3_HYPJQ|nr:uncharacterized protein TRIREDRAFT_111731 [Trichoderma reesei QM6a]EGR44828.1 predicted protein [Trichoderma reesei QM6a]ETR97760.1 hypothetical protein M419DRAFT_134286 [Trichoderma reesei RUT C-30]
MTRRRCNSLRVLMYAYIQNGRQSSRAIHGTCTPDEAGPVCHFHLSVFNSATYSSAVKSRLGYPI